MVFVVYGQQRRQSRSIVAFETQVDLVGEIFQFHLDRCTAMVRSKD